VYDNGVVVILKRDNTLSTSCFEDDVAFSYNEPHMAV